MERWDSGMVIADFELDEIRPDNMMVRKSIGTSSKEDL